ncbi:hypothetical protein Pmani_034748 [Petrolisthes manimaculis]|uniref:Beta-1,4-glucuronyltransferase 1 n=1 Tax=Petrolisthes manimaculis TaxID=1843537 RepID=A0AAE1TNU6_9EUCA|nr:hypothetical protein Pmani_034748 [Petrolisthes manimaculis]
MFPRWLAGIVSWRSVVVLTALASILQLTNLVLTWQLKQKGLATKEEIQIPGSGGQSQYSQPSKKHDLYLGQKVSDDHQLTLTRIARWGVLDGSGGYRVAVGAVRGATGQQREGVTLVTQCSLQLLHKIPSLVKSWQGVVSVAVFAVGNEVVTAVQAIHQLCRCHPEVHQNVTFSLVHPLGSPPDSHPHVFPSPTSNTHLKTASRLNPDQSLTAVDPCNQQRSDHLAWRNYEYEGIQYPNNLLRNTARKAAMTPFIFVVDVDMTPSQGLHQAFSTFAHEEGITGISSERKQGDKTVWVVPAYEIREDAKTPTNKDELLLMKERGDARPFYQELCLKCQKFTDYFAWERGGGSSKPGNEGLHTLYEVLWRDPWEPFYVAPASVPPYDERFRQYGFNRISQVCELHVAGYKFLVLDSAFVVHRGFKTQASLHPGKDTEQEHNRLLFRQFKVELKAKYPESSRRCY